MCNIAHQIQAGYPGIQHSGKATSCAPPSAASSMSLHVFVTDLGRSSHSGSAWVTATRTVVGGISLDDIVLFDNAAARDHARVISRTVLERLKLELSCGTGSASEPILNLAIGFIPLRIHALCKSLATAVTMCEGTARAKKEQIVDLNAWY
jgi:hypothetical protein